MTKLIRWFIYGVITLVALVALAVVAITQWINPNDYRHNVETLAAEQGVVLKLSGDVVWRFYPSLGLTLNDVTVASAQTSTTPLLVVHQMGVSVRLLPLFKRQIIVDAIDIDDANIHAVVNDSGNNWQFSATTDGATSPATNPDSSAATTTTSPPAAQTEPAPTTDLPVTFSADHIALTNITLTYEDQTAKQLYRLDQLNVAINQFTLAGTSFPLEASARLLDGLDLPPLLLQLKGNLAVQSDGLLLQPLRFQIVPEKASIDPLAITLTGEIGTGATSKMALALETSKFNLRDWMNFSGQMLDTADPKALTSIQLSTRIEQTGSALRLTPLRITLDNTIVEGEVGLNLPDRQPLAIMMTIDNINLDRYLPTPVTTAASEAATDTKPVEPILLPIALLAGLNYQLDMSVQSLQAKQAHIAKLLIKSRGDNGLLTVNQLDFNAYEGKVTSRLRMDARQLPAKLTTLAEIDGVSLLPLLEEMASEQRLSGQVAATLQAESSGMSVDDLVTGLRANIIAQAENLQIAEMDIERSACEVIAMLNRETLADRKWQGHTPLQNLTAKIHLADQVMVVDSLQSGIDTIQLNGSGKYRLGDNHFNFPLDLRISGERQDSLRCQIRDRWRNRDLPVLCKGTLETLGAGTCLPDISRLTSLLKEEVSDKVKEKVDKEKDKLNQKLDEKLKDKLGTEDADALKNLLKGFGKKE